ncbi:hypothetical protein ABPG74_014667 [Tetrahymena malaccensis]
MNSQLQGSPQLDRSTLNKQADSKHKDISPNTSRDMMNKSRNEEAKSANNTSRNTHRSKRKNYFVQIEQKSVIENMVKKIDKVNYLKQFFESKTFNNYVISLTIFYTILMFCEFSIDDPTENFSNVQGMLQILQYIEIVVISLIILEILLKCYAYGIKVYFKQRVNIIDAVVISLSLILVLTDQFITQSSAKIISKFFRIFFRFLRLFIILRKMKNTNKKALEYKFGDKTPIEKILAIIDNLKQLVTDEHYYRELEWASQMISTNKLYEPILGKEQKELEQWMQQYDGKSKIEIKDEKKKDEVKEPEKDQTANKEEKKPVATPAATTPVVTTAPAPIVITQNIVQEVVEEKFVYQKIETSSQVETYFENLDSREFMVFEFFKENLGKELSILLNYLFEQYQCFESWKLQPEVLFHFSDIIQQKYLGNPYHNKIHAFDVTQTMHFFLKKCNFAQIGKLSKIDIGTAFIASAIHDVEHPGFNNPFQMNAKTDLAILYNDKSPLENHHLSVTFKLVRDNPGINIFEGIDKKAYKNVREAIIQMILKTDMNQHFTSLAQLKGRLASNEFDAKAADKSLCLNTLLHAADVSNPFKPFHIYQEWTHRVLNEFWIQGDVERQRGLPLSYLCDRYTTNIAKSQIGFIDFIVQPYFETICQFIPELLNYMPLFEQNKQEWQSYEEYYDRQLVTLQAQQKKLEERTKTIDDKKKDLTISQIDKFSTPSQINIQQIKTQSQQQ